MKPFIVALALVCVGTRAYASECEAPVPKAIAEAAQVAFLGTVIAIEESSYKPRQACWDRALHGTECGGKLVTLQVTDRLRGMVESTATVMSEDACNCLGPYWKAGMQYLVIAQRNISNLPAQFVASNQCGGTMELSKTTQSTAEGVIRALKAPKR